MLHIGKPEDIPAGLVWYECTHLPTVQQCAIVGDDLSVETPHGTMTVADEATPVLMRGANGALYALKLKAVRQVYSGGPPPQVGEDPSLITPTPQPPHA